MNALGKLLQKAEANVVLKDKRLREFDINPLELKINELIESLANLQGDDKEMIQKK